MEGKGERAEHRVHLELEGGVEDARRDGNADGVVEERPEKVLFDVADDRAAQLHGGRDVEKIAAHQHDIRRLDSDVRARTDGNADVCARKGGRVVDAVADHGNLLAALLQAVDLALLILRQHLGHDAVHADLTADGLGGLGVVAREHDDLDAHVRELGNGLRTRGLDDVGHGNKANELAVESEVERRLAVLSQRFAAREQVALFDAVCLHHAAVAGKAELALDLAVDALTGDLLKFVDGQ